MNWTSNDLRQDHHYTESMDRTYLNRLKLADRRIPFVELSFLVGDERDLHADRFNFVPEVFSLVAWTVALLLELVEETG